MPRRGRNRVEAALRADVWYRAEASVEMEEPSRYDTVVFLEFPVVRRTPQGVYLRVPRRGPPTNMDPDHRSNLKWVPNQARKRYAYPSKLLALESLRMRKHFYQRNCEQRLRRAERQNLVAMAYNVDVEGGRVNATGHHMRTHHEAPPEPANIPPWGGHVFMDEAVEITPQQMGRVVHHHDGHATHITVGTDHEADVLRYAAVGTGPRQIMVDTTRPTE